MISDFSNLIQNGPTDVAGFEREISKQIASMSQMVDSLHDIEELIVAALKRRCNDRRTVMHAHLRLKNGAKSGACAMTWNEVADLAETVAPKGAANAIFHRLANFYMRIASLQNRIEHVRRCSPVVNTIELGGMHDSTSNPGLLTAYAKNEETLREKHHQNQRDLDRVMQTLFLDSEIHPDLTQTDLPVLEAQVNHIAERGCTVQELRRLKIMEALLEEDRFDALMKQLAALTK
jgi:hypothetical protein